MKYVESISVRKNLPYSLNSYIDGCASLLKNEHDKEFLITYDDSSEIQYLFKLRYNLIKKVYKHKESYILLCYNRVYVVPVSVPYRKVKSVEYGGLEGPSGIVLPLSTPIGTG